MGSVLLTGYLLVNSTSLFNPLLAAFIVALVLRPFATKLEYIKVPRLGSTFISLMLFILVFFGLVIFFSSQIRNIDFEIRSISDTFNGMPGKIQNWLTDLLGISLEQQISLLKDALNALLKNSASFVNSTLQATTNFLTSFVIFIISLFFLLYYRSFFVSFLYKVVKSQDHVKLSKILNMIQAVVSSYVLGVLLVILIVATLNILGLYALGIANAIFFGVMAAVLTLIPYIGILLGALLPIVFALVTKNSFWYPLGVLLVFMLVQFIEGNFLTPNIVGRQVSINPFAAILGLIIGGMLLGFTGIMFALPVLAILKVICDNVSALKPMGYLIGNPQS